MKGDQDHEEEARNFRRAAADAARHPAQISDAKLLADLDVEIAAAERAANPPEGSTAVINALSPGLAAMMPTATKQARKKLLTLQQVRKRLAELIEKEYQHE